MPVVATLLALPRSLGDAALRRYGFRGLSYEFIASQLFAIAPALAQGRGIVVHLGSGASLCAMQAGCSVETIMGFSTLDGLVMATRPGGLDPGTLLYLLQTHGMTAAAMEDLLYHRSGLLGVSAWPERSCSNKMTNGRSWPISYVGGRRLGRKLRSVPFSS